jgi:hypothetical protein
MARQTAAKKTETVENTTAENTGTAAKQFSPAVMKVMATTLKAAEQSIVEEFSTIAHSEYKIGQALTQIRQQDLYLAAKEPCKNFSTYLDIKAAEWRTSKMSLYNYMNLTIVSEKMVQKVGKTIAAKIGALDSVDSKAAGKALDQAVKVLDSGKTRTEAMATVTDISTKAREKAGVSRSPGRAKAAEEKAQAAASEIKAAKKAAVDEISTQDRAVCEWLPLSADKATANSYTRICIVEVEGLRLQIRSSEKLIDVKVLAKLSK